MELDDLFGNVDLESIERKVDFERMLATLSQRDWCVVMLYAEGYKQAEIGTIVGLSQQRAGQIINSISKRLQQCY